jgi:hypothetical protein
MKVLGKEITLKRVIKWTATIAIVIVGALIILAVRQLSDLIAKGVSSLIISPVIK